MGDTSALKTKLKKTQIELAALKEQITGALYPQAQGKSKPAEAKTPLPERSKEPKESKGEEAEPPQSVEFLPHVVSNKYLKYLKEREGRKEKGEALRKWDIENFPEFPYGAVEEIDWDAEDLVKRLPIYGPVNWPQIWSNSKSIGEDYKQEIERDFLLLQQKFDSLNDSQEKLKDIQLISHLGAGSFGSVWKCRAKLISFRAIGRKKTVSESEQVELACKIIRLADIDLSFIDSNPDGMQVFVDYINSAVISDMLALRYLKHENICKMIDVIHIPDSKTGFPFAAFCLFLELCDGNLFDIIQSANNQRLSETESKVWFRQIADAVDYLHNKENTVNLDIKPANILYKRATRHPASPNCFSHDLVFKLCDFGTAMSFPFNDTLCRLVGPNRAGTPAYQAPEMFDLSEPFVRTKPCDVHCLGVTLISSLMSRRYFTDIQYQTRDEYFNSIAIYLSPEALDLVRRMTETHPLRRPIINEILIHNWLK